MSGRPNVTPISLTTGVGPKGRETLLIQPPSDNEDGDGIGSPTSEKNSIEDVLPEATLSSLLNSLDTDSFAFSRTGNNAETMNSWMPEESRNFYFPPVPEAGNYGSSPSNIPPFEIPPIPSQPTFLPQLSAVPPSGTKRPSQMNSGDRENSTRPQKKKHTHSATSSQASSRSGSIARKTSTPRPPKPSTSLNASSAKLKQRSRKKTFEEMLLGGLRYV